MPTRPPSPPPIPTISPGASEISSWSYEQFLTAEREAYRERQRIAEETTRERAARYGATFRRITQNDERNTWIVMDEIGGETEVVPEAVEPPVMTIGDPPGAIREVSSSELSRVLETQRYGTRPPERVTLNNQAATEWNVGDITTVPTTTPMFITPLRPAAALEESWYAFAGPSPQRRRQQQQQQYSNIESTKGMTNNGYAKGSLELLGLSPEIDDLFLRILVSRPEVAANSIEELFKPTSIPFNSRGSNAPTSVIDIPFLYNLRRGRIDIFPNMGEVLRSFNAILVALVNPKSVSSIASEGNDTIDISTKEYSNLFLMYLSDLYKLRLLSSDKLGQWRNFYSYAWYTKPSLTVKHPLNKDHRTITINKTSTSTTSGSKINLRDLISAKGRLERDLEDVPTLENANDIKPVVNPFKKIDKDNLTGLTEALAYRRRLAGDRHWTRIKSGFEDTTDFTEVIAHRQLRNSNIFNRGTDRTGLTRLSVLTQTLEAERGRHTYDYHKDSPRFGKIFKAISKHRLNETTVRSNIDPYWRELMERHTPNILASSKPTYLLEDNYGHAFYRGGSRPPTRQGHSRLVPIYDQMVRVYYDFNGASDITKVPFNHPRVIEALPEGFVWLMDRKCFVLREDVPLGLNAVAATLGFPRFNPPPSVSNRRGSSPVPAVVVTNGDTNAVHFENIRLKPSALKLMTIKGRQNHFVDKHLFLKNKELYKRTFGIGWSSREACWCLISESVVLFDGSLVPMSSLTASLSSSSSRNRYFQCTSGCNRWFPSSMWTSIEGSSSRGVCTQCRDERVPSSSSTRPSLSSRSNLVTTLRGHNFNVLEVHPINLTGVDPSVDRLFGIELELEYKRGLSDSSSRPVRPTVKEVEDLERAHWIIKRDGSLNDGVEFVTAPASMEIHRGEIKRLLEDSGSFVPKLLESRSTCGLHVHVSRRTLTELQIYLTREFIALDSNYNFLDDVAGRSGNSYCRRKYPKGRYKFLVVDPETGLEIKACSDDEKYSALNTIPDKTIEFRLFASTTSTKVLLSRLQFCDAILDYFKPATSDLAVAQRLEYTAFLKWLFKHQKENSTKWPEFMEHLSTNYPEFIRIKNPKPGSILGGNDEPQQFVSVLPASLAELTISSGSGTWSTSTANEILDGLMSSLRNERENF